MVISLVLLIFWIQNVQKTLRSFPKEELKEKLKLKEMPKIEIPKIPEEEVKKME